MSHILKFIHVGIAMLYELIIVHVHSVIYGLIFNTTIVMMIGPNRTIKPQTSKCVTKGR